VKKFAGLVAGSFASGIALFALSSPAQAVVACDGNRDFFAGTGRAGANCGFLGVGDTFEIDVTEFFTDPILGLGTGNFNNTPFGIGISTSGGSTVSFSNVQAVVDGVTLSFGSFDGDPIAIWGANPDNPFGSATSNFTYTPTDQVGATFQTVAFSFGDTGIGVFGSGKASPNTITLDQVNSFLITGTLASVGDPFATNVISFGVGPGGIPASGSTFGGYFTTQVPGPLPLAGVGAAFAWSRRLRRKQASAAAVGAGIEKA